MKTHTEYLHLRLHNLLQNLHLDLDLHYNTQTDSNRGSVQRYSVIK